MISLPHSIEAEKAILGLMLTEKECLVDGLSKLKREHFYNASNQLIYKGMEGLFNDGGKVDLVTLNERLEQDKSLGAVGGHNTLIDLAESSINLKEFPSYLTILRDKYLKRKAIEAADKVVKEGMADTANIEDFSKYMMDQFWKATPTADGNVEVISSGKLAEYRKQDLIRLKNTEPVYTGYENLDGLLIGGFQPGDVSITAGRPGMGKSSFKANIIKTMCERGLGVVSFALEQSFTVEQARIEALLTGLPLSEILDARNWPDGDYRIKKLKEANDHMDKKWNYHIIVNRNVSLADVRNILYRISQTQPIDIIFFDLFDKLTDVNISSNKAQNVGVKLGELSRIAEEFSCHVNCLVQINRRIDTRSDKRPSISDLKDSGAYEEVARLIMLMYREQYYYPDSLNNAFEVLIAKQSNGPNGTAMFDFNDETLEMTPSNEEQNIFDS
tara:strand:- start:24304 stop:25635 length:1332 start_codon:yes stop_codon:yes gene_type:complete